MKETLTIDIVKRVCETFAGSSCRLNDLRTAIIFSRFSGLFKVRELLKLKATDVNITSFHLEIAVKRSRIDQYGLGDKVFIAKTTAYACAHGLIFRYFALAGILPHCDAHIFRANNSFKAHSTKPAINKPIWAFLE